METFKISLLLFLFGFFWGLIFGNYLLLKFICLRSNVHLYSNDSRSLKRFQESFIFIGVMTTRKNLITRVEAIERTWGKLIPKISGKLTFFIGKGDNYNGNLSVVVLDDVSDEIYPPQKKCFSVIKYMHDNYLDKFEWFMRADDDMFMKPRSLERFLRSVNSSRQLYMGQPALGRKTEKGKLGLNTYYCLGGPGIVFSRNTLRQLVPGIMSCLNNTVTSHEDTELGRCVYHRCGLSCTLSFEFERLFYQNNSLKNWIPGAFPSALTMHPIKEPSKVYKLHNLYSLDDLSQLKLQAVRLQDSVDLLNKMISQLQLNDTRQMINEWKYADRKFMENYGSQELEVWNFIKSGNEHSHQLLNQNTFMKARREKRNVRLKTFVKEGKSDVSSFFYESRPVTFGLRNVTVVKNKSKYRARVAVRRFLPGELTENTTELNYSDMYMILPMYKYTKSCSEFLQSLNVAVSNYYSHNIFLNVVTPKNNKNEYFLMKHCINKLKNNSKNLKIKILQMTEDFSRAKAMKKGLENLSPNSLVVIMDVDMRLTGEFLHRVFLNTKLGKQVYFPIYFSQYDPNTICFSNPDCFNDKIKFNFDQDYGTWRHSRNNIVGVYKSDMEIESWERDSDNFVERSIKKGLTIFRATDTGLYNIHSKRTCDVNLSRDELDVCVSSWSEIYGSQRVLAEILLTYSNLTD